MSTGMAPLAMAIVVAIYAVGIGSSDRARAADVIIGAGDESPASLAEAYAIRQWWERSRPDRP